MRDLRIYTDYLGGNVYHYRDKSGLECDAVIHLPNGQYGLIEIKLGGDRAIEEAILSLKKLHGIMTKYLVGFQLLFKKLIMLDCLKVRLLV